MAAPVEPKPRPSFGEIAKEAGKKALGGGIPGAAAMAIQVSTLMWLRTTMNYQYRHGTTTLQALKTLYKQGGLVRFYRGYVPALAQAPLSRFGDTAANAGAIAFLESYEETKALPMWLKSVFSSLTAASFRTVLMPIDACKTIMQVEGKHGLSILGSKIRVGGPTVLFHGAIATSGATFVGHYPWFMTYNVLNEKLPFPADDAPRWHSYGRNGLIGFVSSVISDTSSNSLRVIKTTKQTHANPITYYQAVTEVIQKDGVIGLFGRGLKTRILTNGLQGLMFTILWRELSVRFGFSTR